MLLPQDPSVLLDFSGCGNTLDANDPITAEARVRLPLPLGRDLHVDGFRFDEGTVLTRDADGSGDAELRRSSR